MLNHRRIWLGLGVLGLFFLAYLSLTPSPHHLVKVRFGDKVEHALAFAAPMFWFGQLYASPSGRAAVALVLLTAGVVLEIGQRHFGGYARLEYRDMVASGLGVALGAALLATPLRGALAWAERWVDQRRGQ